MRSIFIIIVFNLISASTFAQAILSGKVTDTENNPLPGANVFIQDSFDGATTDSIGNFSFKTDQKGIQNLSASFIGYKPFLRKLDLDSSKTISVNIILQKSIQDIALNSSNVYLNCTRPKKIMNWWHSRPN